MEREKQLVDKKRATDQKIMEEHVYAQLWKLDLAAKEERERKEVEEKKKRVNDTQAVLDWQKDTRVQAKVQDRELTDIERRCLKSSGREKMRSREKWRDKSTYLPLNAIWSSSVTTRLRSFFVKNSSELRRNAIRLCSTKLLLVSSRLLRLKRTSVFVAAKRLLIFRSSTSRRPRIRKLKNNLSSI